MVDVSLVLQPNRTIEECVAIAKMAEQAGFDGIWVSDENPGYGFRDTYVVLAA
ncbi:MAG: LLM class flavin-dependent oxidoreductase, partial [Candidatus Ranarchaeia archaeon]